MHQILSPYHLPMKETPGVMSTDLLLTVDQDFHLKYHSRKLTAKLRKMLDKEGSWVFYKENKMSERELRAMQTSFLINSLMFI